MKNENIAETSINGMKSEINLETFLQFENVQETFLNEQTKDYKASTDTKNCQISQICRDRTEYWKSIHFFLHFFNNTSNKLKGL